jgi:hypothetical protein
MVDQYDGDAVLIGEGAGALSRRHFIEWLIGIVAVIAHYFHGNLLLALWLVWSVTSPCWRIRQRSMTG